MEGEEGGMEHRENGQVHEGNSEEEGEFDEGQEEEGLQQKETEGGSSNRDEGEGEKDNDKSKEQTTERDTQWTEMEISGSSKSFLDDVERDEQGIKDQNKETDSEEETRMDNMEKDRGGKLQTRRRTLKVKPNVENARRKRMTMGRVKSVNRYEVLRGLEGED